MDDSIDRGLTSMIEYRCKECGKLLFRAAGPLHVEIMCSRSGCKNLNEIFRPAQKGNS